jgi:hypothetical protein
MLDNLAAFLVRHAYDEGRSDADRLQIVTLVNAFHEGDDDPLAVESAMRATSVRFAAPADYPRRVASRSRKRPPDHASLLMTMTDRRVAPL